MKLHHNLLIINALLLFIQVPVATASDLEKERRWSEQITESLMVGEATDLTAGQIGFLGLYTEASEGPGDQAVILMHGMGAHPDWPEIISPLRGYLPDHGWATLSIQLPILTNEAAQKDYAPLFDEVAPRVDAATVFLQSKGIKTIVLIGHSLGASMAATYLAGGDRPAIKGLVVIGMGAAGGDERMSGSLALEKIRIPVLDIYGSRDLENVLDSVTIRHKASRIARNPDYRQLQVEGADHFFLGLEDTLNRRVYGWLKTSFEKPTR